MNQIKLKVCGLRDNISDVVAMQPDYVGFIFYNKSPRFVGEDFPMPAIEQPYIKKTGVFVNESLDFICQTLRKYHLDFAQLHGSESPQYCLELKNKGIKIIKAFQVHVTFDFDRLKDYEPVVDYFLFDTRTKQYGGSGKTFDWKILNKYSMNKKYFLSGGLSLDNIGDIAELDLSKIHALDVNSKFEISPGLKNIEMLKKLNDKLADILKEKI